MTKLNAAPARQRHDRNGTRHRLTVGIWINGNALYNGAGNCGLANGVVFGLQPVSQLQELTGKVTGLALRLTRNSDNGWTTFDAVV